MNDVERAIAIVKDSRLTHVHWAEWRRNGGSGDDMAGDLAHHETAIRDYDHVLGVLARQQDASALRAIEWPNCTTHHGCRCREYAVDYVNRLAVDAALAALTSSAPPALDVERLARALDVLSEDGLEYDLMAPEEREDRDDAAERLAAEYARPQEQDR